MFGSGKPDWSKGGDSNTSSGNAGAGLNNRFQSYQQGGGSYVPPGTTYAEQQTNVLHDTVKTQYEAEGTAANVMSQLHSQRGQIQNANDDAWKLRETNEMVKRELVSLAAANRRKKQRLYIIIAMLGTTDFLLFWRIVKCHGSFFC